MLSTTLSSTLLRPSFSRRTLCDHRTRSVAGRRSVVVYNFKFLADLGLKKPSWLPSFSKEKDMGTGSSKTSSTPAGSGKTVSGSGYDIRPLTPEEREAAAQGLTDFQRYVTLKAGTERAGTGTTVNGYKHDNKEEGVYVSAVGGLPLFSSKAKYDSGTGWPSFFAPIDPDHVIEVKDTSIPFSPRVEVLDARSGAHLGHVFNDGPRPTGKRYCMNAAALKFIPKGEEVPPESKPIE